MFVEKSLKSHQMPTGTFQPPFLFNWSDWKGFQFPRSILGNFCNPDFPSGSVLVWMINDDELYDHHIYNYVLGPCRLKSSWLPLCVDPQVVPLMPGSKGVRGKRHVVGQGGDQTYWDMQATRYRLRQEGYPSGEQRVCHAACVVRGGECL